MSALKDTFKKYPNPVFIETGSFTGEGIKLALDAGFETIYSIELDPKNYYHCWRRYKSDSRVNMIYGDSAYMLEMLLNRIKKPVTFWLDGHSDAGLKNWIGAYHSPIMQELTAIEKHYNKKHIIIIDDLRHWKIKDYGFNLAMIQKKIYEIDSRVRFIFEDGTVKNDILVAMR